MSDRSVIVVVLDRWGAGQVSALGATTLEMPAINRLAASALTANFCFADSPDLERVYRSYWEGLHAADLRETSPVESWLMRAEASTLLVTDEPFVRDHPLARHFEEKVLLPPGAADSTASEVAETHLAKLLFAAGESILNLQGPSVTWIHAQAMEGPWDAPLELRQSLADEEDPDAPTLLMPPAYFMDGEKDYDVILGISQAYGGQVLALDEILGGFIDVLDQRPAETVENTLLIVTSPRGFPLAEHGAIGGASPRLYAELLHTPLFVRLGRGSYGEAGALQRTSALVQPADIAATIAHWQSGAELEGVWGKSVIPLATRPDPASIAPAFWRSALAHYVSHDGQTQSYCITPGWSLRSSQSGESEEAKLEVFAKPDDRWEVNEIGSRVPQVRELLVEQMAQMREAVSLDRRESLAESPDILVRPER